MRDVIRDRESRLWCIYFQERAEYEAACAARGIEPDEEVGKYPDAAMMDYLGRPPVRPRAVTLLPADQANAAGGVAPGVPPPPLPRAIFRPSQGTALALADSEVPPPPPLPSGVTQEERSGAPPPPPPAEPPLPGWVDPTSESDASPERGIVPYHRELPIVMTTGIASVIVQQPAHVAGSIMNEMDEEYERREAAELDEQLESEILRQAVADRAAGVTRWTEQEELEEAQMRAQMDADIEQHMASRGS